MNTLNYKKRLTPGRLTILAAAIASVLAVGQLSIARADPMGSTNSDTSFPSLENPAGNTLGGYTAFTNTGNIDTLTNGGTLSGDTNGIYNAGTINTLSNTGIISALNNQSTGNAYGINNSSTGSIGALSNSGTISGSWYGIYNEGGLGTLNNNSVISSDYRGIQNDGTITSLNNNAGGSIFGGDSGIYNTGTIDVLSNSGTLDGRFAGISNTGTITSLTNEASGVISSPSGAPYGILNSGTIGTLSNNGSLSGRSVGLFNEGTIGALNNSGSISTLLNVSGAVIGTAGNTVGINNGIAGSISFLNNNGAISGSHKGIQNDGTIAYLNNGANGRVSGHSTGIFNSGTLGTLSNSGLVASSGYAIYNSSTATLGAVTNAGTIAGTIQNDATQDLTINGGTGSTFGLLTGASGGIGISDIGLISTVNSNLVFASGNLLLNDNIDVGSNTVSNAGSTLQINNPLTITGNYSQGASASLILGVGSNAVTTTGAAGIHDGYGRLIVSGSANIDLGSSVGLQKLGTYGFAQGQRYVVIQANTTGTNYNASSLHYTAAGYNVAGATVVGTSVVDHDTTNLLVTLGGDTTVIPPVTPVGPTTPITPPSDPSYAPINRATSTDGIATLAGLFNYGGYNAGLMNLFNASAALDSSAAGNRAGAQLSPTANLSAATQASAASTLQVLNMTTAHIDGLRTAQNGNSGSGVATGESASSTGLWGQGFGGSSRLGERDDVAGYHAHYSGLLLGADAALNDSWRAGGLFSYTDTTVNNDGDNSGSSADVKSYGLFGYATYTGSPWYVDLSLGAVQHQYDTTREVDLPGFSSTAKGQHDGMQYIASVLAGYPIDLGSTMANTVLTPIAGLTYSTLRQDSYTEKDGGGAALHVSADNIGSLKSDLGTKLERSFGTPYGNVVPSAQLTWRHEYRDNGLQSVANYAADTSGATSFTTTGAKAVADTGVLALGVTLIRSQNLSVGAKYTLEAASGYTANTGDVQVRWDF